MSPSFVIAGLIYGAISVAISSFSVSERSIEELRKDLSVEIALGGVKAAVCRLIQPLIWLLTLPMESLSSALALATLFVCAGALL